MLDLTVYYDNGCIENVSVQMLGVSYEGGTSASADYLDTSDMKSKGITITRSRIPLHDQVGEKTIMDDYPLVRPDRIESVIAIKNGIETLMFRDRYGCLLTPEFAMLFDNIEVSLHIAEILTQRLGAQNLPLSVVEKLIPPEESAELDTDEKDCMSLGQDGDKDIGAEIADDLLDDIDV